MELMTADGPQPLQPGRSVQIADDVRGEVTIAGTTAATNGGRLLELHLFHMDNQPIDDAVVRLIAHMPGMEAPSFQEVAAAAGDGSYVVPLAFSMPGEWQMEVEVGIPGQPARTLHVNVALHG
jgi:hypothetical protein